MSTTRKTVLAAILALIPLSLPLVSSAAAPQNLVELANMLAQLFNSGATFLVLLAFILLFWTIIRSLIKKMGLFGEGTQFSKTIMVAIFALFVMVSIWGIIRLLQETLFGSGNGSSSGQGNTSAPLSFPNSSAL